MEEYEKVIDEERKQREPKIEEGKEPTDEQKQEIMKLRQELSAKKLDQFQTYLSDIEPIVFNTNVFKSVKLAVTPEELAVEEEKVKALATFLKETAVETLIKNMQRNEGVPTDSQSLSEFFHQNGVNIRYLGYIAEKIKKENMNFMKQLLEREVVVRCLKHILNIYIRDIQAQDLLSGAIAHALNCLLAPKDFVKRLDEG